MQEVTLFDADLVYMIMEKDPSLFDQYEHTLTDYRPGPFGMEKVEGETIKCSKAENILYTAKALYMNKGDKAGAIKYIQNVLDHLPLKEISIAIGGAVTPTAVFTEMLHADVAQETKKAYQLKAGKHTCWIPKKALVKPAPIPGLGEAHYFKLAKWFKPDRYTEWFLTHYAEVSGQSAT